MGRQAFEAYQDAARALAGALEASAGQMRPPPLLSGGAPVPVGVTASDAELAASMLGRAGSLSAAASALADPGELGRLADGALTPGAALQFVTDVGRVQQADQLAAEHSGSIADRFGGEIDGIFGWHAFGNPKTKGYQQGDALGSLVTDSLLAGGCVLYSAGACAVVGTGLFVSRGAGIAADAHGADDLASREGLNLLTTALTVTPAAALDGLPEITKFVLPDATKFAITSEPIATHVEAASKAGSDLEELLKEGAPIRIGSNRIPAELPVKAVLEGTGLATGQSFEQARRSAGHSG